jgi:hypothetical protein
MTRRSHAERLGSDRTAASMGMVTRAIRPTGANGSVVSSCRGIGFRFSGLGLGLPIYLQNHCKQQYSKRLFKVDAHIAGGGNMGTKKGTGFQPLSPV